MKRALFAVFLVVPTASWAGREDFAVRTEELRRGAQETPTPAGQAVHPVSECRYGTSLPLNTRNVRYEHGQFSLFTEKDRQGSGSRKNTYLCVLGDKIISLPGIVEQIDMEGPELVIELARHPFGHTAYYVPLATLRSRLGSDALVDVSRVADVSAPRPEVSPSGDIARFAVYLHPGDGIGHVVAAVGRHAQGTVCSEQSEVVKAYAAHVLDVALYRLLDRRQAAAPHLKFTCPRRHVEGSMTAAWVSWSSKTLLLEGGKLRLPY